MTQRGIFCVILQTYFWLKVSSIMRPLISLCLMLFLMRAVETHARTHTGTHAHRHAHIHVHTFTCTHWTQTAKNRHFFNRAYIYTVASLFHISCLIMDEKKKNFPPNHIISLCSHSLHFPRSYQECGSRAMNISHIYVCVSVWVVWVQGDTWALLCFLDVSVDLWDSAHCPHSTSFSLSSNTFRWAAALLFLSLQLQFLHQDLITPL